MSVAVVEHRRTPADATDLPKDLRGVEYLAVVVDRSPEARAAAIASLEAHYCPTGHKAGPGEHCDRCGLTVPVPPPLTAQERISASFCPRGHTAPKGNGACARCGASIAPPLPGNW